MFQTTLLLDWWENSVKSLESSRNITLMRLVFLDTNTRKFNSPLTLFRFKSTHYNLKYNQVHVFNCVQLDVCPFMKWFSRIKITRSFFCAKPDVFTSTPYTPFRHIRTTWPEINATLYSSRFQRQPNLCVVTF